jgi:DNA-binding transcriptional regulator of glucitol operon
MSLKAFHIVFVVLTTLASLAVSAIGFFKFSSLNGGIDNLLLGVGGVLSAAALLVYGRYVLKKLQHISYL